MRDRLRCTLWSVPVESFSSEFFLATERLVLQVCVQKLTETPQVRILPVRSCVFHGFLMYSPVLSMKVTLFQTGLLVLIAVVVTAVVSGWLRPAALPNNITTSSNAEEEIRPVQTRLAAAKEQQAIVARLEERHYHITYDYLSTPSSDPAPAVERLVEKFGRDFVGAPYYIGNSVSLTDVDLISQLPSLQIVDFDDTGVTDRDLRVLKKLPRLRVLFLNSTSISSDGLAHLTESSVETLHLQNCSKIDDSCVAVLSQIQSLKDLYISRRDFSPAAIQLLESALPSCVIH